jgi:hypothetical protein
MSKLQPQFGHFRGGTDASSKRLKEKGLHGFGWQNGYGAFSVSESNAESVTAYIINQAEHHVWD